MADETAQGERKMKAQVRDNNQVCLLCIVCLVSV